MLYTRRRVQRGSVNQQEGRSRLREKLIGGSIGRYAPLMGALIKSRKEECAWNMVQRSNDATLKAAQIKLRKEECALSMGQRSNDAVVKDVQTTLWKEECVGGTGQRSNDAVVKDVQTTLWKEECAGGTGQKPSNHFVKIRLVSRSSYEMIRLSYYSSLAL